MEGDNGNGSLRPGNDETGEWGYATPGAGARMRAKTVDFVEEAEDEPAEAFFQPPPADGS